MMMYKFKKEKFDELTDGRTIKYISEKLGVSRENLNKVLTVGKNCDRKTAILISSFDDTILNLKLEQRIKYYFDSIEE